MKGKEWFESWFDTEYYHILYHNRNDKEAERFIANLFDHLKIPEGSKVLDLACGKGRHARTMASKGVLVTGADLSENSISYARQFENEGLNFLVHDMREKLPNAYKAVFNLFTSFGYFNDLSDNERVVQAVYDMLEPNGYFVIDFMNAIKVVRHLITSEEKNINGISFKIERKFDGQHIYKHIRFSDKGQNYHYTERVQYLIADDFRHLLSTNGFVVREMFGDFNLSPFDQNKSDRLIIIAQKAV